ncbi:MAG: hypothetical protein ACYDHP_00295 [Ferrimicrobium sp.]
MGPDVATANFVSGVITARRNGRSLDIFPVMSVANGGLLIKIRNPWGDRAVLIEEFVRDGDSISESSYRATWMKEFGCFRLMLDEPLDESCALDQHDS